MDDKEKDLKIRLIEILLIISGLLIGIKQISETSVPTLFILFFATAIMYFIVVSNDLYQSFGFYFRFLTFLVAVLFSASLAIAIGVSMQGTYSFRSIMAILYYVVFTLLIFIALSEKEWVGQQVKKIKK